MRRALLAASGLTMTWHFRCRVLRMPFDDFALFTLFLQTGFIGCLIGRCEMLRFDAAAIIAAMMPPAQLYNYYDAMPRLPRSADHIIASGSQVQGDALEIPARYDAAIICRLI